MSDEEKPKPKRRGGKRTGTMAPGDNVVGVEFGDQTTRGSRVIVPPPGTRAPKSEDGRKSAGRSQVRLNLGKRWTEITEAVADGEYSWEEFCEALDPEELARGQLRDSAGGFSGRPPKYIPRAFYNACVRELMSRGQESWKRNYLGAIDAMTAIAKDTTAKPGDRIKAAQFVIERLEGKVPDKLELSVADPWQEAIDGFLTDVDDEKVQAAQSYLHRRQGSEV